VQGDGASRERQGKKNGKEGRKGPQARYFYVKRRSAEAKGRKERTTGIPSSKVCEPRTLVGGGWDGERREKWKDWEKKCSTGKGQERGKQYLFELGPACGKNQGENPKS